MSVADSTSITVGSSATPDNNFKFLIDDLGGMTLKSGGGTNTVLSIDSAGVIAQLPIVLSALAPTYVAGSNTISTYTVSTSLTITAGTWLLTGSSDVGIGSSGGTGAAQASLQISGTGISIITTGGTIIAGSGGFGSQIPLCFSAVVSVTEDTVIYLSSAAVAYSGAPTISSCGAAQNKLIALRVAKG